MILRIAVFVMMSLGLLGFGTVAWLSTQQSRGPGAGCRDRRPSAVLIASRDLSGRGCC